MRNATTSIMMPSALNMAGHVSLGVETFGAWGQSATEFLSKLATMLSLQLNTSKPVVGHGTYNRFSFLSQS